MFLATKEPFGIKGIWVLFNHPNAEIIHLFPFVFYWQNAAVQWPSVTEVLSKLLVGLFGMILLKTQATRVLQADNGLEIETKLPYDLIAGTGQDRTSSVGSGDLRQKWNIPLAVAGPWHFACKLQLVDGVPREQSLMKTTLQDELFCHRLDNHVFNHDILHSGQRWN